MLRSFESFDHYADAIGGNLSRKLGWSILGGSNVSGRFGGGAINYTNNNQGVVKTIDQQGTWTIGFAWKVAGWANQSSNAIFYMHDGSVIHIALHTVTTSGNKIEVRRGAGGTLLATTTKTFLANTWYYIELKVTISDTVGSIDMQFDGIADTLVFASGSNGSQDTRNGGLSTASTFVFVGQSSSVAANLDDVYFCDGTDGTATQGRANNSFLGDCRVQTLMPSGNGTTSNLVGSDGNSTNNYQLVDETASDTSDYVESSTVNDKDSYAYADLSASAGTVYGVQVNALVGKTDAGARQTSTVTLLSGTEVLGTAYSLPASTSPNYDTELQCLKPGGGTWGISDVNSSEFGIKVIA